MSNSKRFFIGLVLIALALGFIAAPPAHAADKARIISGELCVGDTAVGFVRYDGKAWTLDEAGWKARCRAISNAGVNAVRVLAYGVWDPRPYGRRSQFQPWVYDAAAHKWDLSKFNAYYFPVMRRVVELANSQGLEVWFAWFDTCQLQNGYWTVYSPWKYNLQGISHFFDPKADPYAKAWVRRIFKELAGLKVLWPWGNELDQSRYPEWTKRVVFPLIKELAIPFNRMTYGATMNERPYLGQGKFADQPGTYQDIARKNFGAAFPPEKNKFLILREVHKCGTLALDKYALYGHRPAQAAYWWGGKPVGGFVLSDDGVHENKNPVDGGRPDAARWKALATWAFGWKNCAGVEHLPEGGPLEYQVTVFKAISLAYKTRFGAWPENYGKRPK